MRIQPYIVLSLTCFFYACSQHPQPGTNPPQDLVRIAIDEDQVFDLSGFSGSGGASPYALFDENTFVDPRYDRNSEKYIPITNCQPVNHPAIYFQLKKGNRIVVDFEIPYELKEIWFYDRSNSADSFWIYTGNLRSWKLAAPGLTVSSSGQWGWRKISLNEETRFLMIRFSSFETAITEMVLYGIPKEEIPEKTGAGKQKGFTRTPLKDFLGVNLIMENDPQWLRPFHFRRFYNFSLDFDQDTNSDAQKRRFNMLHYGRYDLKRSRYIFDIDTIQKLSPGINWFSIRGVPKWMDKLGFTDKDRPVNSPGMDTENPASYTRHAEMMWNLAAFFGNTRVDTNLLSLVHEPRISGRGSMSWYENGNEEDANWVGNKYASPFEYYAQSTADWDGDEARLGKDLGIYAADSGAKLMMSGLIGLDTQRVKTYRFLTENLRQDRVFIWKAGIQYHHYSQEKNKGITPEQDSLRWKLARVAQCSYRVAPEVKCILGENGYDKSQLSKQNTPLIPGYSSAQSQGILILRSINASFFSGFDAYILYWLEDAVPENDAQTYLTSGIIRKMTDGKIKVYPGWYYINTLVNRLGDYRADSIIREDGDCWIYRYRNMDKPDSIALFIYQPSVGLKPLSNYTIEIGRLSGTTLEKIIFQEESTRGKAEIIRDSSGKIKLDVGPMPQLIFYKEERIK